MNFLTHSEIKMMKRIKITSVLLLLIINFAAGQNVPDSSRINLGFPVYSQYLQNGLVINPAYTGTREVLSGFLSYRMQWIGTSGAPLLQSLSFHSPMKNDKVALGMMAQFMQYGTTKSTSIYGSYANDKVALGMMAQFMQYGTTKSTSIYGSYAYHIKLKKGKISFGT